MIIPVVRSVAVTFCYVLLRKSMPCTWMGKYKYDEAFRERLREYQREKYRQDPDYRRMLAYKRHLFKGKIVKPKLDTLKRHNLVEWYFDLTREFDKERDVRDSAAGMLQSEHGLRIGEGDTSTGKADRPFHNLEEDKGVSEDSGGQSGKEAAPLQQLRRSRAKRRVLG